MVPSKSVARQPWTRQPWSLFHFLKETSETSLQVFPTVGTETWGRKEWVHTPGTCLCPWQSFHYNLTPLLQVPEASKSMSGTNAADDDCTLSQELSLSEMSSNLKPQEKDLLLVYSYQRAVGAPHWQRESMDWGRPKEQRSCMHAWGLERKSAGSLSCVRSCFSWYLRGYVHSFRHS